MEHKQLSTIAYNKYVQVTEPKIDLKKKKKDRQISSNTLCINMDTVHHRRHIWPWNEDRPAGIGGGLGRVGVGAREEVFVMQIMSNLLFLGRHRTLSPCVCNRVAQ